MKYANIENWKIIGITSMELDGLVPVPDSAVLFDYYINGVLYPATENAGKIPTLDGDAVTWSDDPAVIQQGINAQIAGIDAQISAIEAKTYRPLRELLLDLDTDETAKSKLTDYNKQIADLRIQRATLADKTSA